MEQRVPLSPNKVYHVYTRGNNRETVFKRSENYSYFLQLYKKYVSPFVDTFAYCLLPNHFHLFIRINDEQDLKVQDSISNKMYEIDVVRQFSHLLNAYTKAINKKNQRIGSLFQERFRRKEVNSPAYSSRIVYYIYSNPHHHGVISNFQEWPHSSFVGLLSTSKTSLQRNEVLEWFGGRDEFRKYHEVNSDDISFIASLIEEDTN